MNIKDENKQPPQHVSTNHQPSHVNNLGQGRYIIDNPGIEFHNYLEEKRIKYEFTENTSCVSTTSMDKSSHDSDGVSSNSHSFDQNETCSNLTCPSHSTKEILDKFCRFTVADLANDIVLPRKPTGNGHHQLIETRGPTENGTVYQGKFDDDNKFEFGLKFETKGNTYNLYIGQFKNDEIFEGFGRVVSENTEDGKAKGRVMTD